ncbi:MAG: serine hydroxymethyltransferase [Sedimentisphaerales bacterium]|nr:serine hydroxymethyltransferase [Sedimentisphaerales bacterium]
MALLADKLSSQAFHEDIFKALKESDSRVYELIAKEYERQQNTLQLIAAENQCSRAVLGALGSVVQNKTTEGFPGARYHGGCEIVDEMESLASARAREAFGARYANVQPHSGTAANQIILTAILERGDRILSLGLDQGGHLSHGARVSFSGKFFDIENYYVERETFVLDYDVIRKRARELRPKLLICGASAYSRTIDFRQFREIADSAGAYLLADISHIAGLVIAGAHLSCVDYAHFTTTSTYKPGGPRGGLILMGKDYDRRIKVGGRDIELWEHIEKTTFPGVQGTPYLNNVAAKAVFFKETLSDEYKSRQFKIIENAKVLAHGLMNLGYDVVTGGTDNHMVLVNVGNSSDGMTGLVGQKCLEECGIIVNKNRLPYDKKGAAVSSGIRLGTPIVTKNGMGTAEMESVSALIDAVLRGVKVKSESEYEIDKRLRNEVRDKVKQLCVRFPMRY